MKQDTLPKYNGSRILLHVANNPTHHFLSICTILPCRYVLYIYIISTYHHLSCEFEPRSQRGVLDATLCDKVCQWLARGQWFSPGNLVSSTNKTDRHNITEILLKVALNTINLNLSKPINNLRFCFQDPNCKLTSIALANCEINPAGIEAFIQGYESNTSLEQLNLNGNEVCYTSCVYWI